MAKWSKAYINNLPDSAFLIVLSGGDKEDGYTEPRSKRKFPVRDKQGNVDKDHLDDALARIPDSKISDSLKDKATRRAEKLLNEWKKANKVKKSFTKSMGGISYGDLRSELQSVVQQKYGKKSKDGSYWTDYPWIVDIYEDEFVVEKDGKYYIADYEVDDDGKVKIDEFYPARKLYSKQGKTPVKSMGTRASVDIARG
jgi:hypothetical protein